MIFQCMFAVITPALITGAFAERIKFSGFLLFTTLWLLLVYCPMAHWVWGGGWLSQFGALDFAGGAVVHMSSGASALAAALYLGRRTGYGKQAFIPHNLPLTILGAGLLWFGWFGFNAGSALAANGLAASAFVTTHLAAARRGLGLDRGGMVPSRQAHHPGHGFRCRGRSGRHHPGRRLRRAHAGHPHGPGRRRPCATVAC